MKNWKLILVAVTFALVAIVVAQNTEDVLIQVLFAEVNLPRAVLLIVTFAAGFVSGVLLTLKSKRSKRKSEVKPPV